MAKKIVTDLSVKGKKVLVRVDFNVPLKDGVITDDNRIVQALPTIQYLIDNHAKVILFSHLGKVKSEEDKARLSLRPVAERLSELLKKHGQSIQIETENDITANGEKYISNRVIAKVFYEVDDDYKTLRFLAQPNGEFLYIGTERD